MSGISHLEVFGLGACGGGLSLIVTQLLPAGISMIKTGAGPANVTRWTVAGLLIVIGVCLALGGGAAIWVDATTAKTSIVAGVAWESLLGGLAKGANLAMKKEAGTG